jgi:serine/threonine protein kinase
MDHRTQLQPGTVLDGKYRIERLLGAGGFGITYEAYDIGLASRVALKEYFPTQFGLRDATHSVRPRSEGDREIFERLRSSFIREARTLNQFDHPAIVRVLNVFEAYGTAYMVMKYETGASLKSWLADLGRRPTQDELDRLTAPLLDALEAMHASAFLHRDIAPDNIIVRADGSPVLLDFGASRRVMGEMTGTLTGVVKKGYSPQEQYATDGRSQGPWTDIYALGATLYRCVSGDTPEEATQRILDDQVISASKAGGDRYRPEFLKAIDAAMMLRPADRPQSVTEWRKMLFAGARRNRRPELATAVTALQNDRVKQTSPPRGSTEPTRVAHTFINAARGLAAAPRRHIAVGAIAAGVIALFGGAVALTVSNKASSPTASVQTPTAVAVRSNPTTPQATRGAPAPSIDDARRRLEEQERARWREAEELRRRQQEQIEQLKLEAARHTKEVERLKLEEEQRQRRLAEESEARRRAEEVHRLQQEQIERLKREAALRATQPDRQPPAGELQPPIPASEPPRREAQPESDACRVEGVRLKALTARGPSARRELVALSESALCPDVKEKAKTQLRVQPVNLPKPAKEVAQQPKKQRDDRSAGQNPTSQAPSGKCRRETWAECQGRINPRDAALCDTELRIWKC